MEPAEQLISEKLVDLEIPLENNIKNLTIECNEDPSTEIQIKTLRNWVNVQLKKIEGNPVVNIAEDFRDGLQLTALVQVLIGRKLPEWKPRVDKQEKVIQVSQALKAFALDRVKLVDIGIVLDIVNGNFKSTLSLLRALIIRYQIGRSQLKIQDIMLTWLKACLPECKINNLTTDWNSGVNLSALLDYCKPGLFPNWHDLDPADSVENCRKAMEIAESEFQIPAILEPNDFASPNIDEFSFMTYFSYFVNENSPGFYATLKWVNSILIHAPVQNFTTDWDDGRPLNGMVKNLSGKGPLYEELNSGAGHWVSNNRLGIENAKEMGIEPILEVEDIVNQYIKEHLGVMALAAQFKQVKPRPEDDEQSEVNTPSKVSVHLERTLLYCLSEFKFKIVLSEDGDPSKVTCEVHHTVPKTEKWWKTFKPCTQRFTKDIFVCSSSCKITWDGLEGTGTIMPVIMGMHKLMIHYDEKLVNGCPHYFRAMPYGDPALRKTANHQVRFGTIISRNSEFVYYTFDRSTIVTSCISPGEKYSLSRLENETKNEILHQPDAVGVWRCETSKGDSRFFSIYDENEIKIEAILRRTLFFDTSDFLVDKSGVDGTATTVNVDVVAFKHSLPTMEETVVSSPLASKYCVKLRIDPTGLETCLVYVYANGFNVPGSPFPFRFTGSGSRRQLEPMEEILAELNTSCNPSLDQEIQNEKTKSVDSLIAECERN